MIPLPANPWSTPARPPLRVRRPRHRGRGFTLIEAALTTVIIGTGVLAIVAAQQAYHAKNGWAQRAGTAMLLANEIRERMVYLDLHEPRFPNAPLGPDGGETHVRLYDDVNDFVETIDGDGVGVSRMLSPPISALGEEIEGMEGWAQQIRLKRVNVGAIGASDGMPTGTLADAELIRVTADVYYEGELVSSMSWLATPKH